MEGVLNCKFLILLEHFNAPPYILHSPLSKSEVLSSLCFLAELHGKCMESNEVLKASQQHLLQQACYFKLQRRRQDLTSIPDIWAAFVESFSPCDASLFAEEGIQRLGVRLQAQAEWIDEQLQVQAHESFCTLVHGDFKAMNVLVHQNNCQRSIPIDFQWTGLGFGTADVALHLHHSVHIDVMRDGGEEELLRHYHRRLLEELDARSDCDGAELRKRYSYTVARRHYELSVLDYARMVFSSFYRGVTPATCAKRAGAMNASLVYRDVPCALRFVRRVDELLRGVEAERDAAAAGGGGVPS